MDTFIDDRVLLAWRTRHPIAYQRSSGRHVKAKKKRKHIVVKEDTRELYHHSTTKVPSAVMLQEELATGGRVSKAAVSYHVEVADAPPRSSSLQSFPAPLILDATSHLSHLVSSHQNGDDYRSSRSISNAPQSHNKMDLRTLCSVQSVILPTSTDSERQMHAELDLFQRATISSHESSLKARSATSPTASIICTDQPPEPLLDDHTAESRHSYPTENIEAWLSCEEPRPRAGYGWISPHPLSMNSSSMENPPQSHISFYTQDHGLHRLSYDDWCTYQARGQLPDDPDLHAIWADERDRIHMAAPEKARMHSRHHGQHSGHSGQWHLQSVARSAGQHERREILASGSSIHDLVSLGELQSEPVSSHSSRRSDGHDRDGQDSSARQHKAMGGRYVVRDRSSHASRTSSQRRNSPQKNNSTVESARSAQTIQLTMPWDRPLAEGSEAIHW